VGLLERFGPDRRVRIVTGAPSGPGAESARQMAAAGARLAIGARRAEGLTDLRARSNTEDANLWRSRSM
jgi:NADP-dependent 3-hydroxy acid dehydrogenase YdfG